MVVHWLSPGNVVALAGSDVPLIWPHVPARGLGRSASDGSRPPLAPAIKRADAELQHCTELYTQGAQHALDDQQTYCNLIIHYQSFSQQISAPPGNRGDL